MLVSFLLLQVGFINAGYVTPEQLRLSFTNKTGEMRITWVVYTPITNYLYYQAILCNSSHSSWQSTESSYYSFDQGTVFVKLQYIHSAVIQVDPACIYQYYAGSWLGWSPIYEFSGRTPDDNDLDPTDFIIVADWGGGSQGKFTKELLLKQMRLRKFDAVLHAGDFAYDLDEFDGLVGDSWLNMIQPVSAKLPYMALPGNHENFHNSSHYKNRFIMPYNEANQGTGFFYSFNMGRTHYVMIDTEIYLDDDSYAECMTQTNWLKQDLKRANEEREKRPWIVMLTHRNMYCSVDWLRRFKKNGDCGADAMGIRKNLEDIVYENKVDLFLQAHVHQYERNSPIYKNQSVSIKDDGSLQHVFVDPQATIYITNGNAGNIEGHNDPVSSTPQKWSLFRTEDYGYGRLVVYNQTHLYYEQYSSITQSTIDYLWIIKSS